MKINTGLANLDLRNLISLNWSYSLSPLLISTDCALIVVHLINKLLTQPNELLDITKDGGYAELFQYIKEFWLAITLFLMFRQTGKFLYFAWAMLFFYLLCDDAFLLHEGIGSLISISFNYQSVFGLRPLDLGEITVHLIAGILLLSPIIYFHGNSRGEAKQISQNLGIYLSLFVFFGLVVDFFHVIVSNANFKGLTLLEDGGEMIVISLLTSYVFSVFSQKRQLIGKD